MATQWIILAVWVNPLAVFVAFVSGDDDDGPQTRQIAAGFKNVRGPDGVGLERGDGFAIAPPHKGLGGHVDHDFGLEVADQRRKTIAITDVARLMVAMVLEAKEREHIGVAGEFGEGDAANGGS